MDWEEYIELTLLEQADDELQISNGIFPRSWAAMEPMHEPREPAKTKRIRVAHIDPITEWSERRERLPCRET
jgi:hypothetical protein